MLRALIVEDEPSSRDRLRRLLASHATDIVIVAEADNGPEAVRLIDAHEPSVVFLDVSLPGLDGFEVLASVKRTPAVIFTTAHDEFAVRAFRTNAIDYLLKPIEPDQLAAAVGKVVRASLPGSNWSEVLNALKTMGDRRTRRIACRIGDSTIFVATDEVQYFQADQGYTVVKTASKELLVDTPLMELESRLDPNDFVRIHRSTLVNMNHVTSLKRSLAGRVKVVLKDGTELSSSRRYADNLRSLP
jgi:two-component system LytT family response regulator